MTVPVKKFFQVLSLEFISIIIIIGFILFILPYIGKFGL